MNLTILAYAMGFVWLCGYIAGVARSMNTNKAELSWMVSFFNSVSFCTRMLLLVASLVCWPLLAMSVLIQKVRNRRMPASSNT